MFWSQERCSQTLRKTISNKNKLYYSLVTACNSLPAYEPPIKPTPLLFNDVSLFLLGSIFLPFSDFPALFAFLFSSSASLKFHHLKEKVPVVLSCPAPAALSCLFWIACKRQRKTHWHLQLPDRQTNEMQERNGQLNRKRTSRPNWSLFSF